MEEEEKHVTLFDIMKKGYELIEKSRVMREQKEINKLKKRIEDLKVEKTHEEEKAKLLSDIKTLEEEIAKKKLEEVS